MRLGMIERARRERGASAVEFALLAIPLLTLLIAIIQFSIWFWAYQVGAHAAREGARQYAVHPCPSDESTNDALVVSRVGPAAAGTVTVNSTVTGQDASEIEVGDEATVEVSFTAHNVGGLVPSLPTVTKSATVRVEYVPDGGC